MSNNLQIKKVRFLHVTNEKRKLRQKNFRKPRFNLLGGENQNFQLDGCLYLSKAHENGTSNWLQYRERLNECTGANGYKRIGDDNEEKPDSWLTGTYRYYLDVDFSKHKIYIVDNAQDYLNLLIDYGYFNIGFSGEGYKTSDIITFIIISKFFENFDGKYDWIICSSKVQELIKTRTKRNMPLLQIFKYKLVIPNNEITNEFLADLIRSLNYYEKIIGNVTEQKRIIEKYISSA